MFPTAAGVRNIAPAPMRYVPALYSGKLLVKFYAETVLSSIANTDYEGEISQQGDTVYIRSVPDIQITDHVKGGAVTYDQPKSESTSLLIDKGKKWAFATDYIDKAQTDIKDYTERWTTDAAKQLKIAIDRDVLGNVYVDAHADNQGTTAGAVAADIDLGAPASPLAISKATVLEKIVDLGQVLDEQNVPEEGRFLVAPPWFCSLIKKSELRDASLSGDPQSILRNGRIGMVDTFTIYKSNLLETTSDTGHTVTNMIFGTKDALTFASQLTENENLKNPFGFGWLFRGLQVYGYQVIKPEALGWLYGYKA
jgi:hypothetical protein